MTLAKRASVEERLISNEEIVDANIRNANLRAEENMRKIDEDLQKVKNLRTGVQSVVDKNNQFLGSLCTDFVAYKADINQTSRYSDRGSSYRVNSSCSHSRQSSVSAQRQEKNRSKEPDEKPKQVEPHDDKDNPPKRKATLQKLQTKEEENLTETSTKNKAITPWRMFFGPNIKRSSVIEEQPKKRKLESKLSLEEQDDLIFRLHSIDRYKT